MRENIFENTDEYVDVIQRSVVYAFNSIDFNESIKEGPKGPPP